VPGSWSFWKSCEEGVSTLQLIREMQQENCTEQTLIVRVACHSQSLNQQRDAALVCLLSDTVFPLVPCAKAHDRISKHGRLDRPFSHQQCEEARRIRTVQPASQVAREVMEEPSLIVRELERHVIRWNSEPSREGPTSCCAALCVGDVQIQ
jgi:hypothetical protein